MKCQICKCTNDHACAGGCRWSAPELCSQCVDKLPVAVYIGKTNVRGKDLQRFQCPCCKARFNRVQFTVDFETCLTVKTLDDKGMPLKKWEWKFARIKGMTKCPGCKRWMTLKIERRRAK